MVITSDPRVSKGKLKFYVSSDVVEHVTYIEIRGWEFSSEEEATNLDDNAKTRASVEKNVKIPWHNIICIDNLTYKVNKKDNTNE
jgi:hypothetical protein